jgi:ParE toxin of type II toxin-antitoxin system, parDE
MDLTLLRNENGPRSLKSGYVKSSAKGNASTSEAVGSTVSFRLHPDARDELREAVVFYDRAAERFVNAVETAIAALILKPDRFREFEPGVRTCRVPKFRTRYCTP